MEVDDPWLDQEEVKHNNKKSVKPEFKCSVESEKREPNQTVVKQLPEVISLPSLPDKKKKKTVIVKDINRITGKSVSISKNAEIQKREEEKYPNTKFTYVGDLKPTTDNRFLETLLTELDEDLSPSAREFANEHFGQEWLSGFVKDVTDLKEEIMNSRFYVNEKEMILLKYIFLMKQ